MIYKRKRPAHLQSVQRVSTVYGFETEIKASAVELIRVLVAIARRKNYLALSSTAGFFSITWSMCQSSSDLPHSAAVLWFPFLSLAFFFVVRGSRRMKVVLLQYICSAS